MENKVESWFELYTIYDVKADECGPIYDVKNRAVALRNFKAVVERSSVPQDLELYLIGRFDKEGQGRLVALDEIVCVEKGSNIIAMQSKEVTE